jgi:hypothetical protein
MQDLSPSTRVNFGLTDPVLKTKLLGTIFTVVSCSILILSAFFIYQLMHKRVALKILKFTLK